MVLLLHTLQIMAGSIYMNDNVSIIARNSNKGTHFMFGRFLGLLAFANMAFGWFQIFNSFGVFGIVLVGLAIVLLTNQTSKLTKPTLSFP